MVPARVVEHDDPKKMGRVKVQFFWQTDGSTHWARMVSPHAGPDRGFMFMPEVGDEVAVIFEDGDPERPVILGSVWNGVQQAPRHGYYGEDIPNNDVKRIVTKSGNRIQIADMAGNEAITIATPNHNSLTFSESHTATGRPLIALSSSGDIVLSAPEGRVHIQSKYFSREVGDAGTTSSNGGSSGASGAGPPAGAPSEGFFHGLAGGLYGSTLKPLGHMVMHPIETAEGIGHAVAHPVETAQAVGHAVAAIGRGVMSGDGRAIGTAIGTVGMFAIPGADVAEGAEDTARLGQVGEVGATQAGNAGEIVEGSEATRVLSAAELENIGDIKNVQPSEEVNSEMVKQSDLPAWQPGSQVTTKEIPAGIRFNMVTTQGQAEALAAGKPAFGSFATSDTVPSQTFARDNLSILPRFKPDVSQAVTVETTGPQTIKTGIVNGLEGTTGQSSQVQFVGERALKLVGQPRALSAE